MFDFAWTQIGLIGVVALVLIGPKDLPIALKAVAGFVKKARRMAGEFQSHVDEMVKDTELADLRSQISELRSFDIRREVAKAVDDDGSIRATFQQDPFMPPPRPSFTPVTEGGSTAEAGTVSIEPAREEGRSEPARVVAAPAFIPPDVAAHSPPIEPVMFAPPAFIPPAAAETASPAFDPPAHHHDGAA